MKALQIHAGPRALKHLQERGLAPGDVRVVPAAAGGPKGLVLLPLDQFLFGRWLAQATQTVHLLGASIGAWRMAAACMPNSSQALATLAEDYITQTYPHPPGKMPSAADISSAFAQKLDQRLGQQASAVLAHPQRRLHVFTSRGLRGLHRPGPATHALGWAGAFLANARGRQHLGGWMQRVVFGDPREPLPFALDDYPTQHCTLTSANLGRAVLASCSIPFALLPVQDVPGGPPGTYFDGGITDYHLHLPYATMDQGLVLYPHFSPHVVPGWLDKSFKKRHASSGKLSNLVLLSLRPEWLAALPGGKLPDRSDFRTYVHDEALRQRVWRQVLAESQRVADEFAQLVQDGRSVPALPLI